jgi:hypothetical protein
MSIKIGVRWKKPINYIRVTRDWSDGKIVISR